MAEQKKLIFGEAYTAIEGKKQVNRLTNESYDTTAKEADKKIEENNREYTTIYKKAAFFFAKQ